MKSELELYVFGLSHFLHANRYPVRSKALQIEIPVAPAFDYRCVNPRARVSPFRSSLQKDIPARKEASL
jgi:hypothetical protein